jgi:hypothetical protein
MESQRFWIHLTLGLTVSMALGVANLVSGGDAVSGKSDGRDGLPPDRESSSPLRGPSTVPEHLPSTAQTNETKAKKDILHEEKTREPGASAAPRKHPSSHAEKHPDYDGMKADNQKALQKESH